MDDAPLPPGDGLPPSEGDMAIDVMLQVLMIQARTAALLMGQAPHPSTGQRLTDLPRAKILIDQQETAAGQSDELSLDENQMLKDTVHQLRLAYVEKAGTEEPKDDSPPGDAPAKEPKEASADADAPAESKKPEEEEPARKRFVKKYD